MTAPRRTAQPLARPETSFLAKRVVEEEETNTRRAVCQQTPIERRGAHRPGP